MPQATNPPLSRWLCMEMPRDCAWRCLTFLTNPSQTRNHLDVVWCCFTCWTSAWTKIRFSLFNCVSIIIYIVILIFNFWFQQLLILRPFPPSSGAMLVDSRRHPLGERGALTAKNVEDSGYPTNTALGVQSCLGSGSQWQLVALCDCLHKKHQLCSGWRRELSDRTCEFRAGQLGDVGQLFYAVFMSLSGPFQVEKLLIPLWGTV